MSLGFSAPAFLLLAIPVIGGLIYAYLNRGQAKRQIVSSTIIFKQLKNRPSVRQRIQLPWRFFYELLALLILVLSIAGFYWQSPGKYWQVIIDNSLSLSAIADASSSKNILALNIAQLKNDYQSRIRNFSGIKVCVTAPSFECWSDGFQTWDEVISKIEDLKILPANDLLESILSSLTTSPDVELTVYSDYLSNSKQSNKLKLSTVRSGGLGNIAITEILLRPNQTVSVGIQSFVSTPVQKKVKLYLLSEIQGKLVLTESKENSFKLNPDQKIFVDFKIANDVRAVIAEIDSENRSPTVDAIGKDNIAFQVINPQVQAEVLLVSERSISESGLAVVFDDKVKLLSPTEYQQGATSSKKYSLIIFDNYIPKEFPNSNHLIIASNSEPGIIQTELQRSPQITTWDKESALLRYLTPDNFQFKNVWSAKLPSWFHPVISSNNQIILATGFLGQVKSVYLGFPILPLEQSNNQAISILSLNTLKWLEETSEAPISFDRETLVYTLVDQKLVSEIHSNQASSLIGIFSSSDGKVKSYNAKNFYSEEESNLKVVRKISIPTLLISKESQLANSSNPNLNQLIWFVLVMMLAALYSPLFIFDKKGKER